MITESSVNLEQGFAILDTIREHAKKVSETMTEITVLVSEQIGLLSVSVEQVSNTFDQYVQASENMKDLNRDAAQQNLGIEQLGLVTERLSDTAKKIQDLESAVRETVAKAASLKVDVNVVMGLEDKEEGSAF